MVGEMQMIVVEKRMFEIVAAVVEKQTNKEYGGIVEWW